MGKRRDNPIDYAITGTRAYGPTRKDSDLDIVMSDADADLFLERLDTAGIKVWRTDEQLEVDYGGYYIDLGGMQINIIQTGDLDSWRRATDAMKLLPEIHDRGERVEMFNTLRLMASVFPPSSICRLIWRGENE